MSRPWDGMPTPIADAMLARDEDGVATKHHGQPVWYDLACDLERQLRYYKDKLDEARGLLVDWMDSDGWEGMPIDETDAHLEAAKEEA